jgi:hypothetical protein
MRLSKPSATDALPRDISTLSTDGPDRRLVPKGGTIVSMDPTVGNRARGNLLIYAFPKAHWKHLRTTNMVESPFAAVRLRTGAAKRFKKVENATAVICRTLLVASGVSAGSTRPSSCRTWPRASCMSTESA